MRLAPEFGEKAAVLQLPCAVEQRAALVFRQIEQSCGVAGVLFHQKAVVGHARRDKAAGAGGRAVRLHGRTEVDEPLSDKAVPRSAGVGRAFDLLGVTVAAAQPRQQIEVHIAREMRQLIKADHVVFRRLIAVDVLLRIAVAEFQRRAVGKQAGVA